MGQSAKKTWFKTGEVEYSTDLKFFLENQILIIQRGTKHIFCSRLESKTFQTKLAYTRNGIIDDAETSVIIHQIHQDILSGKFGKGELIN